LPKPAAAKKLWGWQCNYDPNVIILDINLPGINGFETIPLIRKFSPGSKILGVSLHTQPTYARKMIF